MPTCRECCVLEPIVVKKYDPEPGNNSPGIAVLVNCDGEGLVCVPVEGDPWVIYDVEGGSPASEGCYAEKTLSNGQVIEARFLNCLVNPSYRFSDILPAGDSDPNALTVLANFQDGPAQLEFFTSVQQPNTELRAIDLDNGESIRFGGNIAGMDADVNTPIITTPGPNGVVWNAGTVSFDANGNESSSQLRWNGIPWGGAAGPLPVEFIRFSGFQSASQFDFGGEVCTGGGDGVQWLDATTGELLSPTEQQTLRNL